MSQLDQDKTEVLIIRSKTRMENLASKHEAQGLNPGQEARNLGVIFDSDLKHMYTASPTQFFFIIWKTLPKWGHSFLWATETTVTPFLSTKEHNKPAEIQSFVLHMESTLYI